MPKDPKEICGQILYTGYLKSQNSSEATQMRAQLLAKEINATHLNADISGIIEAYNQFSQQIFGQAPKFLSQGGSVAEDISL